jgi:hypothetical protein
MRKLYTVGLSFMALTLTLLVLSGRVAMAKDICDDLEIVCVAECVDSHDPQTCYDGCANDWCYCKDLDPCD